MLKKQKKTNLEIIKNPFYWQISVNNGTNY